MPTAFIRSAPALPASALIFPIGSPKNPPAPKSFDKSKFLPLIISFSFLVFFVIFSKFSFIFSESSLSSALSDSFCSDSDIPPPRLKIPMNIEPNPFNGEIKSVSNAENNPENSDLNESMRSGMNVKILLMPDSLERN